MNYRLISDSACDLTSLDDYDLHIIPLHVLVGDKEFIDDKDVNLDDMQQSLVQYKGKTSTSCPSPGDWLEAFSDADVIFCVTITSGLSGSYSSANTAKHMYEDQYPDKSVYIIDTLSTGPENTLIVKKIVELIKKEIPHEDIYKQICEYKKKTHLLFSLVTINNLARNGRVNALVAKGINILGIRLIGQASDVGTLELLSNARGDKKVVAYFVDYMKKHNFTNGKVIIGHNNNFKTALDLKERLENEFHISDILVQATRALDSYYAEPGALLVGFEA